MTTHYHNNWDENIKTIYYLLQEATSEKIPKQANELSKCNRLHNVNL